MVFGYTQLDPLVVLFGTLMTIRYLQQAPVKLIGFMPTALSLWFFVPVVTNLTLWQTVPLLLAGRLLQKARLNLPRAVHPLILIIAVLFAMSAGYALVFGTDVTRVIIRIVYYIGILAMLSFAYEMGRRTETYTIFLKGLVVMGIVYAGYGVYQILAFYTGLPVRGIVYDASGASILASEGALLRVNSLANEPKRLGYVLFLAATACVFLARMRTAGRAQQLRWAAAGIFSVSIMTFAGSYFTTIVICGLAILLLYPSRAGGYLLGVAVIAIGVAIVGSDHAIIETFQHSYVRRLGEIEIGLDGAVVYRQEFFAWDYLANSPLSYLTGVGLGQYYSELNKTYGLGAGFNAFGSLMPLNSNFLELIFDLGAIAASLIYGGLVILIISLRRKGETFFCISLLFLTIQSLTILNLLYIALFAGLAMGKLKARETATFP